jgi:aminoglycoside phosphotransferase (APT) family kinase protein
MRMHADEADIDEGLVRRLVATQFPQWAGLPVEPVPAGTVNALYRLGADLAVRLPRIKNGVEDVAHEHRWLPRLAPPPVAGRSRGRIGRPAWRSRSWPG